MKIAAWTMGVIIVLLIILAGLERAAAERVEVVVLHTVDAKGDAMSTRLWVVDYEGSAYLRVGADGSGWFTRLSANPEVRVERDGKLQDFVASPRPELSNAINDLMQAKYTWGDTLIGHMVGSRENAIPIELQPR